MSDIALRPRSSTELVDAAFQLYRRDPVPFIAGLALIYVPWLVVIAVMRAAGLYGGVVATEVGPALTLFLIGMLVYSLAGGVLAVLARDVYLGNGADVGGAFRTVGARLVPLLLALLGFAVLVGIGFLFLIIPALYVFARLFAIKQAILLEDRGVGESFSRSSTLTEGHKRHVLNTMGLVFLLNLAVSLGATFLTSGIPSETVQMLIGTCVSVLVYPIVGLTETLLYYDVRIRREGFDIEYLAAAGAPLTPEGPAAT